MLFFHPAFFARLGVCAICLIALLSPAETAALEVRQIGVVKIEQLNMRSAPDPGAPVLGVLKKDDRIRVLRETGNWLQVLYKDNIGYVYNDSRFLKQYSIHTVTKGKEADLDLAKARSKEIERKIRTKQDEISKYAKQENTVLDELETIDRELSAVRARLEDIRVSMAETRIRIGELSAQAEEIRSAINEKKDYAQRRIVALYKLSMLGEMNLLATADSMYQMFRRKAGIERVVKHDERVIGALARKEARLAQIIDGLAEKQATSRKLTQEYEQARQTLAAKKIAREKVLAAVKTEKANRMATLKYLQTAARQLDKTISNLGHEVYDTDKAFRSYQGLLKMPVQGKIISKFGKYIEPRSGVANFRNGIEISSDRGAPVRAVFDGKTIFSDWLKGYGRVIIISHGNNYHSVYAHVEDLFCSKGDQIESGEVIATVGDSGSMIGPALYFEIRHQGAPVNPLEWIDNG